MGADLTGTERAFVARALRRRRLFLALSVFGLAVAVGLGVYYTWRKLHDPAFEVGLKISIGAFVLILILLGASLWFERRGGGKGGAAPAAPAVSHG